MDSQAHQSLGMSRTVYGLEVLIHDPNEFPQASITSAVAQPSAEVILSITPSVINSKATIRDVPVNERQCYFEDEVKLRATRKYTMNSCLAECRVDYIVKKCNCLPFFYPDIPEMQNRYHQCGFGDINCLKNINGNALDDVLHYRVAFDNLVFSYSVLYATTGWDRRI